MPAVIRGCLTAGKCRSNDSCEWGAPCVQGLHVTGWVRHQDKLAAPLHQQAAVVV
jgi:hypothetical protein